MKWLNEKLCTFDELVRVELSPQIVELTVNDENLSDAKTHPKYALGKMDSYGNVITKGKKMHVVDWRGKIVPKVWKIYEHKDGRFVQIDMDEDKGTACAKAQQRYDAIVAEMEEA